MVKGAAIRGISKILRKGLRKAPVLGGRVRRGTPTKAGLVARRAALRGETAAEKYKKILGPTPKATKAPKKPIGDKFFGGVGTGAALTLAYTKLKESKKVKKEAEAKQDKKMKEAIEKHEKKTKEKREKHGKPHA